MAGGAGSRFWPFSTAEHPKQFLDLTGEGTMLQLTVRRLKGLTDVEDIWVLTNREYVNMVLEQCPELVKERVVGEPMLRDTAAAIALAAGLIEKQAPGSLMAVLPADHVIRDHQGFCSTIRKAAKIAEQGNFVTIGIAPTYAAETFGYLHKGGALEGGACQLKRFVEKPRRKEAEQYLDSGEYCWNAGMFVWPAAALLSELERHLPKHAAMARSLGAAYGSPDWRDLAQRAFEPLEKISIDFGLMEKLKKIAMVEADFDWNDVGGWLALLDLLHPDEEGNTCRGPSVTRDARGNLIVVEEGCSPVIVAGINDSIIVSARAGTLVCSRTEVERIKELVQKVQELIK